MTLRNLAGSGIRAIKRLIANMQGLYRQPAVPDPYDRPLVLPLPSWLLIDPATTCNLRCPLCPTGNGTLKVGRKIISIDVFRKALDEVPTLKRLELYNWGESLLHPQIDELIRLAKERGIKTTIHSNFSFSKPREFWERLVRSGLDDLVVSADGATQETYEKYRVGGNLSLVLDNIRLIQQLKSEFKRKTPNLAWKVIINRESETDRDAAIALSSELGIKLLFTEMGLGEFLPDSDSSKDYAALEKQWLPTDLNSRREHFRGGGWNEGAYIIDAPCPKLIDNPGEPTAVISSNGKVFPCCYVSDQKWAFGDLNEMSFEEIWNNDHFQNARSLFSTTETPLKRLETVCDHCKTYRKAATLPQQVTIESD